jgi:dCTP deaminase
MKETTPLFSGMTRSEPRKSGILPSQEIRELIKNGKIRSRVEIPDAQIQPASLDLCLGSVAYRVQASFLPNGKSPVGPKIRELQLGTVDLKQPAVLEPGQVFIVPLIESLELPDDIGGKANPKSTTGRLDIFTRLITECGAPFEEVPIGYKGGLYVEIVSRTFSVIVKEGTRLNQLRFFRGNPESDDEQLRKLAQKKQLVYYENGEESSRPTIRAGLRVSVDLQGEGPQSIVAYRAKGENAPPIDLARTSEYEVMDFWEPIRAGKTNSLVLEPGAFYLLASKERVAVPTHYAAEMQSYDPSIGEFTVHYAGFFDPGFGYGAAGEIKGTKAVLEVRAHELPILLEDGQKVIRLIYHKMADAPEKVYGQGIGSSYQRQGLALSKQFRTTASARLAAAQT